MNVRRKIASHLKFVKRFEGIYWKINLYEIIDDE